MMISVIVTCYNYAHYLTDAIESILKQTYKNWEIVIVNDGSTDNTKETAELLISEHPDQIIRLINQKNLGHPALSRNSGISEARGEFVLPLDADDMIESTMLEECFNELTKRNNISFVYTDRLDFDGADQIVHALDYDFSKLKYENHVSYCALFRKKMWEDVGGYRAVGYEDWDYWVAAGAAGHYGSHISKPLFKYRRHDTGRFQSDSKRHELLCAEIVVRNFSIYRMKDIISAINIISNSGDMASKRLLDRQIFIDYCKSKFISFSLNKAVNRIFSS